MPATNQKPAPPTPASPRNTAKYTNKDGSKFITVPKSAPSDSSQPSTPTTATKSVNPPPRPPTPDAPVQAVNRKKQKRRQKAMAKAAAAEEAANGHPSVTSTSKHPSEAIPDDQDVVASDEEEADFALNGHSIPSGTNGHPDSAAKLKKNKKKKKKNVGGFENLHESPILSTSISRLASQEGSRPSGMSRDKIWSTSNHEERERIKEFWLGLGEDERKSLVKVEKDAVLKKMKEQQKHTCSCTVCGRKRTAIEEELEGLYDAYYLELEQFANPGEGSTMLHQSSGDFHSQPTNRPASNYEPRQPSHGEIIEQVGDEDDEDDLGGSFSEDGPGDGEYSEDEPPDQFSNSFGRDMADFLTFGNSLQVKGGILTVADDLLKNDGKRFIEMMEQLAERRMAREEDAREHFSRGYGHPNGSYSTPHNHPPPDDDDYEDEEDEDGDYEESQEEEYEGDDEVYSNPSTMPSKFHTECCCQDPMTEQQRMEEGRRMFQIFAARMFEQRVLSAYKEKVAKERQDKLLEELEEESRQVDQQKAKKAKNAQKKKDKAAQKKQVLAEEKARKEAEKAAEEAARLEAEQKRIAEQKQRAEEKRKQKESQKKAEEEARLKKETERQRRILEQREKQAEVERKAREAKEREKKLKDEQRLRDKQARDQREREAQERKEKQERDKREKEARAAKAQKESQEAAQRAREDKANQKSSAQVPPSQPIQISKRGQVHTASPLPTVLPQHPPNPAAYASPKIPIATPAIPKAPTPIRSRTLSQQQQQDFGPGSSAASQSASGPSQNPSPHPGTPIQASPIPIGQDRRTSASSSILGSQFNQPASPHGMQTRLPSHTPPFQMPPAIGLQPPPGLGQHRPPSFGSPISHEPMFPMGFRPSPNMMMAPPGLNGPGGRGFPPPGPMVPPGFNHASTDPFPMSQGFPMAKEGPIPTHTRQGSIGYDGATGAPTQPKPAPIGRPGSLTQRQLRDEDEDTKHLGSSALVADDEPPLDGLNPNSLRNQPPGPHGGFAATSFMDTVFPVGQNPWGFPPAGAAQPFAPPGFGNAAWSSPAMSAGFGMGSPTPPMSSMRTPSQPRSIVLRSLLCSACRDLSGSGNTDHEGYMDLAAIKSQVDAYGTDSSITEQDLLVLCDTEGNNANGGGTFDVKHDVGGVGKHRIRWSPDQGEASGQTYRAVGAPGEIYSPRSNHASLRGH